MFALQPINVVRPNIRIIRGPLLSEVHVHVPLAEHRVQLPNTPGEYLVNYEIQH